MILVVAPYASGTQLGNVHLGARRKLEAIISIFARMDSEIVLVNSAHDGPLSAEVVSREREIAGVRLMEVIPPVYRYRLLGKFLNLFSVKAVTRHIERYGRPRLVWFYNAYAFEMCMLRQLKRDWSMATVLEFEDWHFSRSRRLNPKPFVDYFLWHLVKRDIDFVFAVNGTLAARCKGRLGTYLLNGVVPTRLLNATAERMPFMDPAKVSVGFFGGLSAEKGADVVLELARSLPSHFVFHVTGAGALCEEFEAMSETREGFHFHGMVDEGTLYDVIARCDVIVNPHASIAAMGNGVFPFKVIEAIASGRLLISTALPVDGVEDIVSGVRFVGHGQGAFRNAVLSAADHYKEHIDSVRHGARLAADMFGETGLQKKLAHMVGES